MLELHCHTTFSDGTLTPTELVQAAVKQGVKALAITDHDTIAGWAEAIAARDAFAEPALEIVPGIELSTVHHQRSLHLLGFYPDPAKLQPRLIERLAGRHRRAQAMAAKLAALGYPIVLPSLSPGRAAGRPHLAAAMVQAGYVPSLREAFDRFLKDEGVAYVPYEPLSSQRGIHELRASGAVPVWAHPYLFRGGAIETTLQELLAVGLMGLEVYHPQHSASQVQQLEAWCDRYHLLKTGGSDYHGPSPELPRHDFSGLNSLQLPLSLLPPLQIAATALRAALPTNFT